MRLGSAAGATHLKVCKAACCPNACKTLGKCKAKGRHLAWHLVDKPTCSAVKGVIEWQIDHSWSQHTQFICKQASG